MKNQNSTLKKFLPAILYIIFGIILIIQPNFLNIVCKILGILLFISAVAFVIAYIIKKDAPSEKRNAYIYSFIACAVLGTFLELLPVFFDFLIPIFIGIVFIGNGFIRIGTVMPVKDEHPNWIGELVISTLLVIIGVVIIVNHTYFMETLKWFIGAALVAAGVLNFVCSVIGKNKNTIDIVEE